MTEKNVLGHSSGARTSSSLLERARARDQYAWKQLVAVYSPLVYWWCRRAGMQAADAADLGQEVFIAVARNLTDFEKEPGGGSFRGWLRTITHNKIRDHFRGQAQELLLARDANAHDRPPKRPEPDSPDNSEETQILYRQLMELVRQEFTQATWRAFVRQVVDDRSAAEVAQELGMTVNSVYLAKSRVLKRLRAELGESTKELT